MPSFGLEMPEIAFEIPEFCKKVEKCLHGKTNNKYVMGCMHTSTLIQFSE